MANVRCPMCSKINPPEAEVCAYCGARIKPLRPPAGGTAGAAPSSDDEPDWLRDLRSDRPGSQGGGGTTGNSSTEPAEDGDVPDWLSRIRDRARTETSSEPALFGEEAGKEKEEEADWLKGDQDTGQSEPSADQSLDDWLSRLPGGETSQPQKPVEPPGAEPFASGQETADWLRGLSEADSGSAQTGADHPPAFDLGTSSGSGADENDWMSKLSAWQSGFTEEESKPATQPSSGKPRAQETPGEYDWLNSLNSEIEAPTGQADQGLSSGTGLTGFLSELEEPGGEQPAAKEEPPAFLADEGGLQWAEPEKPAAPEKPTSGFGLTGFLTSLEEPEAGQEQTPPAGEMREDVFTGWDQPVENATGQAGTGTPAFTEDSGEMPAWMSGGPLTAEPLESAPEVSETGVPDWLRGLEGETPGGPEAAAPEILPSDESGVPDWLRGTTADASPETAAPFEGEPSGLPAWLSSDAEEPAQPFTLPEEKPQAGMSDLPAWLLDEESPVQPGTTGAEPPAQMPAFTSAVEENQPADTGMPDWLSRDFASPGDEPLAAEEAPAEAPAPADAAAAAGLPDWFASFDQSEIEKTQPSRVTGGLKPPSGQLPPVPPVAETPSEAEPAEAFEEAEGPDWLRDFQGLKEEETGEAISPLLSSARALDASSKEGDQPFTVDLPDWLSEEGAALPAVPVDAQPSEARPADIRQQPPESASEQLAQAELPDWVREMRPLESILPGEVPVSETDQRVEKAGPLAGMRGVLPVEEMATRYRKPPIYSMKLHVTEKQRSQAALLESILSQESQSLLIPPARATGPGVLLRVLLALFILAALAFPVVLEVETPVAPAAERFPAENQMFQQINQNLQSSTSGPVLLAVEYEPGLSGEMRMASGAVVAQLVQKKARIVMVSTVAAGPAMGQQLLDDVSVDYAQRVNLGYLPGGTISLVGFATQPWWVAPATLEGKAAWGSDTLLEDVKDLKDFSQVIVLTDRAEVGRAWVEQVQPQLGDDVPMFVVASAQAAPLLQPYVESGQIAGMTSGMMGGAVYAQLAGQTKRDNPALNYLSAYQIGMVVAFLVVLVGGLVSGVMALIKRGNREED